MYFYLIWAIYKTWIRNRDIQTKFCFNSKSLRHDLGCIDFVCCFVKEVKVLSHFIRLVGPRRAERNTHFFLVYLFSYWKTVIYRAGKHDGQFLLHYKTADDTSSASCGVHVFVFHSFLTHGHWLGWVEGHFHLCLPNKILT